MAVSDNEPFTYIPTDAQAKFLASSADVIGFGGNAGGGKSLTAVIWLLGLNESTGIPLYQVPDYRGLLFRKHFRDLRDITDKTKSIYSKVDPGAKFTSSDLTWTFSSGAKVMLSYFEDIDSATTFLQGQELQRIVAEESSQMENLDIFKYCMSRLRTSNKNIKPQIACTMNPSIHKCWMEYFRLDRYGADNKFSETFELENGNKLTKTIQFIRARVQDNPHVSESYQGMLMMLDEANRNALLHGDWLAYSTIQGQVFEHEIKKLNNENRYCHLAHDPSQPVYTFWDIGSSDMTVILFVQFIGKEVRIIDMIKDNNKGLNDFYMPEVMKRKDDLGYRYKTHYMPHDSGKREWTNNTKIIDQARKVTNDVMQLPRDRLADGIQSSKMMFANVWINKSKCSELYEDLTHYRRAYDEDLGIYSDKPVHDKHSHSADAFRYVSYYKPVEEINVDDFYSNRHR